MRMPFSLPIALLFCSACRTPSSTASTCTQPMPMQMQVQSFAIDSAVLHETRRINVYLPPTYSETATSTFPVLYLPDGGLEEDFVHVVDAIHAEITWTLLRPVIVVGIENTERRRDLTGPTEVEADLKRGPLVGGSAIFRTFIRNELMPQVRERYRTTEERAIVGESAAGLFVVETFLLEPDLFDTFIAFDPSVWWNGGKLVREASERLKTMSLEGKRLYMTSANEPDIVAATAELARALEASAPKGLTWFYYPKPDEFHDTIYRASAPRAFRVLFGR